MIDNYPYSKNPLTISGIKKNKILHKQASENGQDDSERQIHPRSRGHKSSAAEHSTACRHTKTRLTITRLSGLTNTRLPNDRLSDDRLPDDRSKGGCGGGWRNGLAFGGASTTSTALVP